MILKPHDLLVALKLVALGTERWTYASLAKGLGLSVSESHACVQRGVRSGLLLLNRDIHSVDEAARATVLSDAIYPMGRRQPRPRGPGAKASDNPFARTIACWLSSSFTARALCSCLIERP